MAELQSLNKPPEIVTCNQLAEHFVSHVFNKYSSSDEIRLIFDRYDLPMSLKTGTKVQRQIANGTLYYHITDTTNIAKVHMKKALRRNFYVDDCLRPEETDEDAIQRVQDVMNSCRKGRFSLSKIISKKNL